MPRLGEHHHIHGKQRWNAHPCSPSNLRVLAILWSTPLETQLPSRVGRRGIPDPTSIQDHLQPENIFMPLGWYTKKVVILQKKTTFKNGWGTFAVPKSLCAFVPIVLATCDLLRSISLPPISVEKDENEYSVHLKVTRAQCMSSHSWWHIWKIFYCPYFVQRPPHSTCLLHFNTGLLAPAWWGTLHPPRHSSWLCTQFPLQTKDRQHHLACGCGSSSFFCFHTQRLWTSITPLIWVHGGLIQAWEFKVCCPTWPHTMEWVLNVIIYLHGCSQREEKQVHLQGALGKSQFTAGCKFLVTAAVISKMVNSVADKWGVAEVYELNLC